MKAYSQPELEVINRNTDWRKAIDGLPGYDLDLAADTEMNLYYRPYIEWELHCENDGVTYEQIADANNPVNTISSIQLFNMVLSFLCLLVMGLIAPFFIVYKQCRTLAGSPESVKDSIASNGMRFIGAIFVILHLAFSIACVAIIKSFLSTVDYIVENKCTEQQTLAVFQFV